MSFDVLIDQFSSGWGLIVQSPAGDLVVPAFDSSGAALVSVSGRAVTGGLSSGSTSLVGIAPAPTVSVAFTGSAVITASGSSTRRCGVTTPGSATITASAAAAFNAHGAALNGSATLTAAAGATCVASAKAPGNAAGHLTSAAGIRLGAVMTGNAAGSLSAEGEPTAAVILVIDATLTAAAGAEVVEKLIPTDIPDAERVRIVPGRVRYACPIRAMRLGVAIDLPSARVTIPARPPRMAYADGA